MRPSYNYIKSDSFENETKGIFNKESLMMSEIKEAHVLPPVAAYPPGFEPESEAVEKKKTESKKKTGTDASKSTRSGTH